MISIQHRPFEMRPEILKFCIKEGLVKLYAEMGVNLDASKRMIEEKTESLAQKIISKVSSMSLNRSNGINICLELSTLDKSYIRQVTIGLKNGPQFALRVDVTRETLKASSAVPKIILL